jgi:hypothetical protein
MNREDEMAAKIETGERQSAGAAAGSDDRLNEQLRVAFKDFQRPSPQPKPGGICMKLWRGLAVISTTSLWR